MIRSDEFPGYIKIAFPIEGWDDLRRELLWCKPITDNEFEVSNIPALAYDLAVGDVVSATEEAGKDDSAEFVFNSLLVPSCHSTIRVALPGSSSKEDREQFRIWIATMQKEWGFAYEGSGTGNLYALDIKDGSTAAELWEALPEHLIVDCGVLRYQDLSF